MREEPSLAIWIADAHREDGKRFVVRADEKAEGVSGTGASNSHRRRFVLDTQVRFFQNSASLGQQPREGKMAMNLFTFRYKQEPDSEGIPRLGIFVEEAEENPDLLTRDPKVKPCTVRYDAAIAMLINESLKERRAVAELNRKIQEQDVTITQLKKQMEIVVTFLKEQYSKIQKVGTELESSRCAPQTVVKFVARPAATLINKIGDRPG